MIFSVAKAAVTASKSNYKQLTTLLAGVLIAQRFSEGQYLSFRVFAVVHKSNNVLQRFQVLFAEPLVKHVAHHPVYALVVGICGVFQPDIIACIVSWFVARVRRRVITVTIESDNVHLFLQLRMQLTSAFSPTRKSGVGLVFIWHRAAAFAVG